MFGKQPNSSPFSHSTAPLLRLPLILHFHNTPRGAEDSPAASACQQGHLSVSVSVSSFLSQAPTLRGGSHHLCLSPASVGRDLTHKCQKHPRAAPPREQDLSQGPHRVEGKRFCLKSLRFRESFLAFPLASAAYESRAGSLSRTQQAHLPSSHGRRT